MAAWAYPGGRLLLFAKAPVAGRVKTRLRRCWGGRGACHVYTALCRRALATAVASGTAPVEIWATPGRAHPWLRARARETGAALRVQPPGDLGRRMYLALAAVLRDAPYAVIVGADCAGLTPTHLREAFAALERGHDVVIAPAEDGGYALIGMRRPVAAVFRAVPWGTARVMTTTRRRLRGAGVRYAELEPAWDVDQPADVHRLHRVGGIRVWPRVGRRAAGPGRCEPAGQPVS